MGEAKKLAMLGAAVLLLFLFRNSAAGRGNMKEPSLSERAAEQSGTAVPREDTGLSVSVIRAPASGAGEWKETMYVPSAADAVVEMTISSEALIKNETNAVVDAASVLTEGTGVRLSAGQPQILIIHTHSSEAYTPAGLDRYEPSDSARTEDPAHNIIRVGDELTRLLEKAGLNVIHDREVYDYPSYTGSYSRSGAAVERYLRDYPSISVVLDVHRDALAAGDVIYKTVAEEEGTCASQVMLLVGTDQSGLEHPRWRENLSLALYLQNALLNAHPTLMRPVDVVPQRYNQQLCPGMLIVEVGSSGNTMQEALAAIRLFADAVAPALLALVE